MQTLKFQGPGLRGVTGVTGNYTNNCLKVFLSRNILKLFLQFLVQFSEKIDMLAEDRWKTGDRCQVYSKSKNFYKMVQTH